MKVRNWEDAAKIEWAEATKEDYCSVFGYFCDFLFDMQTKLRENADKETIRQKCEILKEYCGVPGEDGSILTLFMGIPAGTKIGAVEALYRSKTADKFYREMLSVNVDEFSRKMKAIFEGLTVFAERYAKGERSDMRDLKLVAGGVKGWIARRKKRMLLFFLALVAIGAAAFVALTVCEAAGWLGPINGGTMGWSDLASLFDMIVGAVGFIWERLEDLREETVSREFFACTTDEGRRREFVSTFGPYVEVMDSSVRGSGIVALEGAQVKIHRSKIKDSIIYTSGTSAKEPEHATTLSKAITELRKAQKSKK